MNSTKKKITVITTGGTIGSILQSDHMAVDDSTHKIAQEIEAAKQTLGFDVDVVSPINKNSEVLTPADWLTILHAIDAACQTDCDGIVVTHGTDTMAYTVAAAAAFSHLWTKKVCFTGAFLAPDLPASDTALSLLSALAFAAADTAPEPETTAGTTPGTTPETTPGNLATGVFVAFRSDETNGEAKILNAFDLKPMGFDETVFNTVYDRVVGRYVPEVGLIDVGLSDACLQPSVRNPTINSDVIPVEEAIAAAQQKIACLPLYPGLDRGTLQAVSAGKEVVVIQLYHSGTGPFGDSYPDVVAHIQESSSDTLYLLGSFPGKHIATPYGSTHALIASGGVLYRDIQPHFLYVFSLLALASGKSRSEIREMLKGWEV